MMAVSPAYGRKTMRDVAVPFEAMVTVCVYVPPRTSTTSPATARCAALVMVLKGLASVPALASFPLVATYQVAAWALPVTIKKKAAATTDSFANRIRVLRRDHVAPDALKLASGQIKDR